MKRKICLSLVALLVVGILTRCGSSATSNALSSANTGLTNAPDVTPAKLDTASSAAASMLTPNRSLSGPMSRPGSLDIEIVAAPVTNGVQYTMKQCSGDSQDHYVQITATNDGGKIKYVKTDSQTSNFDGNINITSTVYTDANGVPNGSRATTIRSSKPYNFYADFSSDGTVNKFAGTNGTNHVIGAWNTTLGCAKVGTSGTEVPFTLTVSSTGERTCTASSDTSMCANLPTMVSTIPDFAGFTGTQAYNCQKADGCTVATPTTAIGLEDSGGTFCASLSGTFSYWSGASTTVSCGTTTTASGVCACLWPLYAAATTKTKSAARSGECKVKGIQAGGFFSLPSDLTTSKTVCIENLAVGAR